VDLPATTVAGAEREEAGEVGRSGLTHPLSNNPAVWKRESYGGARGGEAKGKDTRGGGRVLLNNGRCAVVP